MTLGGDAKKYSRVKWIYLQQMTAPSVGHLLFCEERE